ncbi:MAG: YDG domain-containing protein, partial [Limisphaerales bacterium]
DPNVGVGIKVLVPTITISDGNGGNNYAVTLQNYTAGTITALPITVAAVSDSKVYDGTTSSVGVPTITPPLVGTDTATVLAQAFQDPNVGVGNKVLVPTITISDGNGGNNYAVTLQNYTAGTITPLGITGSFTAESKIYDGTDSAVVLTTMLTGVLPIDVGNVSLTGGTATFADAQVGLGKTVTLTGAALTGPAAGNYLLSSVATTTADITPAASTTVLISSQNPSSQGSNVTFTATVSSTAGTPTGDVVFKTNDVVFGTVTLVGGVASISTAALPTGTNTIAAEYATQANWSSSTGSVAQVVTAVETPVTVAITNNGDGTVTVSFSGTPGAQYIVQAKSNLGSATAWENVSTNTAGTDGTWTYTQSIEDQPMQFFRSAKP